jgi:ribonuclease H2 subunit C
MPDMYAIRPCTKADTQSKDTPTPQYTPNIIPCKIHHDGAIDSLDRYWAPVTDEKGTSSSSVHSLLPLIKHKKKEENKNKN